MKLLLFLLIPCLSFSQAVTLDKMVSIFNKRTNEQSVINQFADLGFNKVEGSDVLQGKTETIRLYRTDGVIDAIEYNSSNPSVYTNWDSVITSKGYSYKTEVDGNSVYADDKLTLIITKGKIYSLAIMEKAN